MTGFSVFFVGPKSIVSREGGVTEPLEAMKKDHSFLIPSISRIQ